MPVFRDRAQEKYEEIRKLLKVFLIFYYIMFQQVDLYSCEYEK